MADGVFPSSFGELEHSVLSVRGESPQNNWLCSTDQVTEQTVQVRNSYKRLRGPAKIGDVAVISFGLLDHWNFVNFECMSFT